MMEDIEFVESFSKNELFKWAGFSGDWNPVHFDNAYVSNLGHHNLIVHGMLVMMPLKFALFSNARTSSLLDFIEIKINLKKAVYLDETVFYSINNAEGRFKVCNYENEVNHIGLFKEKATYTLPNNECDPIIIGSADEILAMFNDFKKIPKIGQNNLGIFLDAIIFKHYVKSNNSAVSKGVKNFIEDKQLEETFRNSTVYQVSHNLTVPTSFLNKTFENINWNNIRLFSQDSHISEFNGTIFAGVNYYVYENNELVMIQEMVLAFVPN